MGLVCTSCAFSYSAKQFNLQPLDILQVLANLLALAGVCPFVGSLSDLIGRRYVALIGVTLICIGMIVSSTAHTMNTFIGKTLAYQHGLFFLANHY